VFLPFPRLVKRGENRYYFRVAMTGRLPLKKTVLFLLFFLFQWGGQLSAAAASRSGEPWSLYLIPVYICIFSRGAVWLVVLRDMKLGTAYSLSSLGYLVIPVLSYIVLKEPLVQTRTLGGLMILAGITLFGLGEQKRRAPAGAAA